MAPSFLSNSSRDASAVTHFQIRPEESNIVLRGSPEEASSAVLRGTLVLTLSEPLRIQGIKLRFTGEKRIGFYPSGSGPNNAKNHETILRKEWQLQRSSETLQPRNYEWPFEWIIAGNTRESLEGILETWLIYRMKATIERGMLLPNVVARKQIRIIRTLSPSDLELAHTMSVENLWVDKVDYSLSIPSKAVIFGSTIKVDFRLIPLVKGLKIGNVVTELLQKESVTVKTRSMSRAHVRSHVVVADTFNLSESLETQDVEGQEGYVFSRLLSVPQSLRQCVQDFNGCGIKVRHHLEFNVQMHNPDGHVSELHAKLPAYIFISPYMQIGEDHTLLNCANHPVATAASEMKDLTPPQYGEHVLDRLYSDIDTTGYATPGGPSGVNTPLTSRSRSVSFEDLTSLTVTSNDIAASALQARLSSLNMSGGPAGSHLTARERQPSVGGESTAERDFSRSTTPVPSTPPEGEYFGETRNGPRGNTTGEHNSPGEDGGQASPQHIEYRVEEMSKVPSYATAVQSNSRTPLHNGLPTYQVATSSSMSWAINQPVARNMR